MAENKLALVEIKNVTNKPYVFDLSIEMNNIGEFDLLILEFALHKMYEMQSTLAIKVQTDKDGINIGAIQLERWQSMKLLIDELQLQIRNNVVLPEGYFLEENRTKSEHVGY